MGPGGGGGDIMGQQNRVLGGGGRGVEKRERLFLNRFNKKGIFGKRAFLVG
jgi:hypothetical protein